MKKKGRFSRLYLLFTGLIFTFIITASAIDDSTSIEKELTYGLMIGILIGGLILTFVVNYLMSMFDGPDQ